MEQLILNLIAARLNIILPVNPKISPQAPKFLFGGKSAVTICGMATMVFATWAAFRYFLLDKLVSGDPSVASVRVGNKEIPYRGGLQGRVASGTGMKL